jgi:hypothetical protein
MTKIRRRGEEIHGRSARGICDFGILRLGMLGYALKRESEEKG